MRPRRRQPRVRRLRWPRGRPRRSLLRFSKSSGFAVTLPNDRKAGSRVPEEDGTLREGTGNPDFERRAFLRRVAISGGVALAAPAVITISASPAFASPAPVVVQPVGPDDAPLADQEVVETPPSPFAAPTAKDSAQNQICANGVNLTRGNIKFGHRHIISDGYKFISGVRHKYRTSHPWLDADISATRDCMQSSVPTVTPKRIIYECCRQDPVRGECCRIVVVNRITCNIITSYDTCDGALLPVPVPA